MGQVNDLGPSLPSCFIMDRYEANHLSLFFKQHASGFIEIFKDVFKSKMK
jgi:hypothetical protein